jgi:hypothetical protein
MPAHDPTATVIGTRAEVAMCQEPTHTVEGDRTFRPGRAKELAMGTSQKTAIVLLPGMDGTGELLGNLSDELSTHRPVQLIGYRVDRPLSYDQLIFYVRERVPNDRFVILGESFSGPIAIEIAATDPRVVRLVLASLFVGILCQLNSRQSLTPILTGLDRQHRGDILKAKSALVISKTT